MYKSSGILEYGIDPLKLILRVDQGLSDYYRSLIPRYIWIQPQRYSAHCSVVRNATPTKMEFWGRHEGEEVPFLYEHHVYHGTVYYWLNIYSKRLEAIREELGLPISSPYHQPPPGFIHTFHITIGNTKMAV